MSSMTDAIRNVLDDHDMDTACANIKRIMCDELARVDPTARIRRTEYFNHTFIPDIVLNWDNREPREVFLRFVTIPQWLLADTHRVGAGGPVIFDLGHAARPERHTDELASISSAKQQAVEHSPLLLIADSEAAPHVRPNDAKNMVERLVVANLLRSGRSVLDEPAAKNAVSASRAGYYGAIAAEPGDVRAAVTTTRQILDPETVRRVERTLQLLWWVGGGSPDEFPTRLPNDIELNPSDARDLLREVFGDEQIIEDDAFWFRVAGRPGPSHVIFDKREQP